MYLVLVKGGPVPLEGGPLVRFADFAEECHDFCTMDCLLNEALLSFQREQAKVNLQSIPLF